MSEYIIDEDLAKAAARTIESIIKTIDKSTVNSAEFNCVDKEGNGYHVVVVKIKDMQ